MGIIEIINIGANGIILILFIYQFFIKPAESGKETNIEQSGDIKRLKEDVGLIKANHLPHIERDVNSLRECMVRIETILQERLPKK